MKQPLIIMIAAFTIGLVSGGTLHSLATTDARAQPVLQPITEAFTPQPDMAAPSDHIAERDISIGEDEVVIKVDNPVWAKFTASGSMVPVLDVGANAIEVVPTKPEQINVGDIISYETSWSETPVIHRVIETGQDEQGWFAVVKGDSNDSADPGKIRFSDVRRLVVAIIY